MKRGASPSVKSTLKSVKTASSGGASSSAGKSQGSPGSRNEQQAVRYLDELSIRGILQGEALGNKVSIAKRVAAALEQEDNTHPVLLSLKTQIELAEVATLIAPKGLNNLAAAKREGHIKALLKGGCSPSDFPPVWNVKYIAKLIREKPMTSAADVKEWLHVVHPGQHSMFSIHVSALWKDDHGPGPTFILPSCIPC